jgi:hypothetical protein
MKKYKLFLELLLLGLLAAFSAISIAPETFVMPTTLQALAVLPTISSATAMTYQRGTR